MSAPRCFLPSRRAPICRWALVQKSPGPWAPWTARDPGSGPRTTRAMTSAADLEENREKPTELQGQKELG